MLVSQKIQTAKIIEHNDRQYYKKRHFTVQLVTENLTLSTYYRNYSNKNIVMHNRGSHSPEDCGVENNDDSPVRPCYCLWFKARLEQSAVHSVLLKAKLYHSEKQSIMVR